MIYNFNNIAGYEQEKEELKRLCDVFNNREKYEQKGAKLPKGIIFYGSAGTGKTLFARVLASVCGLEVMKIDLGEVENESAICKAIKKTFQQAARRKNPVMIFFDEMDKVLPNDMENYHTDRSKTILTQLLTLIDGMDSAGNIVFVATCNDYAALPETVIRPGRIDKKIGIGDPDYASRVAILKMYAQRSSCQFDVSVEEIAKLTGGFSCAALETLINECILQSDEHGVVSKQLVYDKLFEIKNEDIPRPKSNVESTVFACRNIGAFVVARTLNDGNYVLNMEHDSVCNNFFNAVISCYNGNYNDNDDWDDDDVDDYQEPDDELWRQEHADMNQYYANHPEKLNPEMSGEIDSKYYSKVDLVNTVTVLLGGYAAQEVVLHKTYDNMSYWLSLVDDILRDMSKQGMFGLHMRFVGQRHKSMRYLPERIDKLNRLYDQMIEECYQRAKAIVTNNETLIKKLIPILVEKEMMDRKHCEPILRELGGIKK